MVDVGTLTNYGQCLPWTSGPGLYKKASEQAIGGEPVSMFLWVPASDLVPALTPLNDRPEHGSVSQKKTSSSLNCVGHGVYHRTESNPGHLHYETNLLM